jgi:hypothetical protein
MAIRKTVLLAVVLAVVPAAVALAAAWRTGTYTAGSNSGLKTGIKVKIRAHSFAVQRMAFTEGCSNPQAGAMQDQFAFIGGSQAHLSGAINRRGHFSGTFQGQGATVKVSGTVKGSKATVKGSEKSTFTDQNGTDWTCDGARTYHARRTSR